MEKIPTINSTLLAMRGAAGANDSALQLLVGQLESGVTERELADRAEAFYTSARAEGFFARIAFGANTAEPYHVADDTPLREGDSIVFNMGCVLRNCLSTAARTLFWQHAGPDQIKVFETVRQINEAAFKKSGPGARAADIAAHMAGIAADAGYADYYRTGESFPQEEGFIIPAALEQMGDATIEEGSYYAVTPGIYVPGKCGACIGDTVLIADYGLDVLSRFPHDFKVLDKVQN